MMKKIWFMLAMLVCVLASCSDGGGEELGPTPKPDDVKYEITIDSSVISNGLSFDAKADEGSISFTTNANWTLTVASTTSGASWCKASATSGTKGSATVKFVLDENTDYEDRSVSVTIKAGTASKTFTITQKAVDALLITTGTYEVAQEGGVIEVEVKANIDYSMEISETAKGWISDASSRALNTYKHTFNIAANDETENREGEITFKSGDKVETVKVYQTGGAIIMLTQDEYIVSDAGEMITVDIKSNIEFGVQMPDVDWIVDEASSRGMSSHTLNYYVELNEGYDSRSAEIIFFDKNSDLKDTLTVIQAQKDAIVISQKTYDVKAEGETIEVKLSANVDFEVTMPDVDWIEQVSSRALKEHTLYFKVAENEGEEKRSIEIILSCFDKQICDTIRIIQSALIAFAPEAVDLGLPSGTLWANMNVGASSEYDYGDFYAWAEITPKEQYDWTTYKYIESEDKGTKMSKYCFSSLGAIQDFKKHLDLSDDCARQNWGQDWRIPTLDEMNELLVCCTWIWTSSYNNSGIAGYMVISNIDGYSDKFIFFPAAGHKGGINNYDTNKKGMYWTSILDFESFASLKAAQLYFNDGAESYDYGTAPCSTTNGDRQIGMSIRPVINKNPINDTSKEWDVDGVEQGYEYVDLGLSVKWATCNMGADNPRAGGDLYSWGELYPKSEYSIKTYKYSSNGSKKMEKYNKEDGLTTLEPEDDAAYMNWGNKWRIPTNTEFDELIENCEWTKVAGGFCGTSKINGKKIILSTITGYRADDGYSSTTEGGHYWSSNNSTVDSHRAWVTILQNYIYTTSNINRYDGLAIRPILNE